MSLTVEELKALCAAAAQRHASLQPGVWIRAVINAKHQDYLVIEGAPFSGSMHIVYVDTDYESALFQAEAWIASQRNTVMAGLAEYNSWSMADYSVWLGSRYA